MDHVLASYRSNWRFFKNGILWCGMAADCVTFCFLMRREQNQSIWNLILISFFDGIFLNMLFLYFQSELQWFFSIHAVIDVFFLISGGFKLKALIQEFMTLETLLQWKSIPLDINHVSSRFIFLFIMVCIALPCFLIIYIHFEVYNVFFILQFTMEIIFLHMLPLSLIACMIPCIKLDLRQAKQCYEANTSPSFQPFFTNVVISVCAVSFLTYSMLSLILLLQYIYSYIIWQELSVMATCVITVQSFANFYFVMLSKNSIRRKCMKKEIEACSEVVETLKNKV